jgi:hypothetical protein
MVELNGIITTFSQMKKIIVVGGGFAGWYTVVALQHHIKNCEILLIDSDKHPTIGVGETTGWDALLNFKKLLGIDDDRDFIRYTGAIYKYGVKGVNFFNDNSEYHWGKFPNLKIKSLVNFYNNFNYSDFDEPRNRQADDPGMLLAWLSINRDNISWEDYSAELDEHAHFASGPYAPYSLTTNEYILKKGQGVAYHLDAERTSLYLKSLAFSRNTGNFKQITSTIVDVCTVKDNNSIVSKLVLENGTEITGDLFIDCSGLKRVLVSKNNNSWKDAESHYNNAAWVCPTYYTDPTNEIIGATEFYGEDYGWRFKVKLYHRAGNGYIFNTNTVDPVVPLEKLLQIVNGTKLAEPKLIKWAPGEYVDKWQGNVVPLGLSAGFVDPFDSPTFDAHSRALEDIINSINTDDDDNITELSQKYNYYRSLTCEERDLRLNLPIGLSTRSGPFWNLVRSATSYSTYIDIIKKIVLNQRTDLEERMPWHWHHIYIRLCVIAGIDMSKWDFPKLSKSNKEMAQAFFNFNRARNKFIAEQPWPNYYEWLKNNYFDGKTSREILEELNPQFKPTLNNNATPGSSDVGSIDA